MSDQATETPQPPQNNEPGAGPVIIAQVYDLEKAAAWRRANDAEQARMEGVRFARECAMHIYAGSRSEISPEEAIAKALKLAAVLEGAGLGTAAAQFNPASFDGLTGG